MQVLKRIDISPITNDRSSIEKLYRLLKSVSYVYVFNISSHEVIIAIDEIGKSKEETVYEFEQRILKQIKEKLVFNQIQVYGVYNY